MVLLKILERKRDALTSFKPKKIWKTVVARSTFANEVLDKKRGKDEIGRGCEDEREKGK